jgi:predicted MFS family arabinose efflux permease
MNTQNPSSGTIRAALRYPAFRWLLGSLAVSQLGDWLYNLALVVLVYDRTGSAMWAGVTTGARVVPIVLLGPLGGAAADRWDRRRLMIGCDLARMGLMVLLAAVAVTRLPILLAPVIAAAATAAASPYLPCVSAVTTRLVDDADLPGANAARSAVTGLGIIAGPALGGLLLLLGSPGYAFALNALTFVLSAAGVLAIGARSAFRPAGSASHRPGLLRGVAEGAAALRAHPVALRLVGADIMCSVMYGAQTVLLLAVARGIGLGADGYGYLFAAIGAGGLLGTALAGRAARLPGGHRVLAAALAAVGLPMLLLGVVPGPVAALLLVAVTGSGALLVEIMTETGLQRALDDEVFGRAYGLALPASLAGIVAGTLIAPALASLLGGPGALIAMGSLVAGYAAIVLRPSRQVPAPAPQPVAAGAVT